MKAIAILLVLGFSLSIQAETVLLNAEVVEYGAVAQATNAPANETITIKRTAATPTKVTLKYKMNTVVEACTEFEIQFTKVEAIEQTVCTPLLNESYDCQAVTHEGYEIPKRVCSAKGLLLTTETYEMTLDFRKAIALSETAEETFEINVVQKKMTSGKTKMEARVVQSASLYKVRASRGTVSFKAK